MGSPLAPPFPPWAPDFGSGSGEDTGSACATTVAGPFEDQFSSGYCDPMIAESTLMAATLKVAEAEGCNAITQEPLSNGRYTGRRSSTLNQSPSGETSWLVSKSDASPPPAMSFGPFDCTSVAAGGVLMGSTLDLGQPFILRIGLTVSDETDVGGIFFLRDGMNWRFEVDTYSNQLRVTAQPSGTAWESHLDETLISSYEWTNGASYTIELVSTGTALSASLSIDGGTPSQLGPWSFDGLSLQSGDPTICHTISGGLEDWNGGVVDSIEFSAPSLPNSPSRCTSGSAITMLSFDGTACAGVAAKVVPLMEQEDVDHVMGLNPERCTQLPPEEGYKDTPIYERWACDAPTLTQSFHSAADCSDAATVRCTIDGQTGFVSNVPCIWDVGGTAGRPLGTCIADEAMNTSTMFAGSFSCPSGGSVAADAVGGAVGGLFGLLCLAALGYGCFKRFGDIRGDAMPKLEMLGNSKI